MVSPGYLPGPLVIPGVAEIVLSWDVSNGKKTSNVLHAQMDFGTSIDDTLCNALMTDILGDARWTTYADFLASTTQLTAVKARDLSAANNPQFESLTSAGPGTGAIGPVPETVALVVTLRTAFAGRTGRGRVYLGGFDTVGVDAQTHAVAGLTAAATGFVNAVMDSMALVGLHLCVASRAHGSYVSPHSGATIPAAPATSTIVRNALCQDNIFDSQRRRKG